MNVELKIDGKPTAVKTVEGVLKKTGSTWALYFAFDGPNPDDTIQKIFGYPRQNKRVVLFLSPQSK